MDVDLKRKKEVVYITPFTYFIPHIGDILDTLCQHTIQVSNTCCLTLLTKLFIICFLISVS
jgi:hypothetical protein